MANIDIWFWYTLGIVAALAYKLQRYVHESKGRGIPFRQAVKDWFEIKTDSSQFSWITTIAIVWAIGSVFVNESKLLFIPFISTLPQYAGTAFLLGVTAEMIAPDIGKNILGSMSRSGDKEQGE